MRALDICKITYSYPQVLFYFLVFLEIGIVRAVRLNVLLERYVRIEDDLIYILS